MAITIKGMVLPHQRREDGSYNVKIRICNKGQRRYIATSIILYKDEITKGLKVKNDEKARQIARIEKELQDISGRISPYRAQEMSVDEVIAYIRDWREAHKEEFIDVFAYGQRLMERYRSQGKDGSAKGIETMLNAFRRFAGVESYPITQITVKMLEEFEAFIGEEPRQGRKTKEGKGSRAKSLYLSYLRIVYNAAKEEYNDEERGIIRIPFSPFTKYKVPRPPITRKRAISVEQLRSVISAKAGRTIDSRRTFARDMFLLSFGLIGMNSVDLYECTQYKNGRITYQRAKTKGRRADNAEISVKVEPKVRPLVEKYRDRTGKRVFNFYKRYATYKTMNANINRGLKEIGREIGEEDLEYYAARHTWATIARNKADVDKETIHEALNHVDANMRVTDIYIDRDYSKQDEANRKVLEIVQYKAPEE